MLNFLSQDGIYLNVHDNSILRINLKESISLREIYKNKRFKKGYSKKQEKTDDILNDIIKRYFYD